MDLNNIILPASVVACLYNTSIIEANEAAEVKIIPAVSEKENIPEPAPGNNPKKQDDKTKWKSLGNNQKNILVIVQYDDAVHLPDNDLHFLTGILGACKLSIADVSIVNINNHPGASYKELMAAFKSRIVFLFAVEPSAFGLPMSFPHYQIQAFAGNSFLFSPPLKDLENDKVQKSKLWVCLKRLFNL
jgi:hypothetical protein